MLGNTYESNVPLNQKNRRITAMNAKTKVSLILIILFLCLILTTITINTNIAMYD